MVLLVVLALHLLVTRPCFPVTFYKMPSRLSGIFARSSKEQEAKAEEAANQNNGPSSDPVPEYSESHLPPPDYTADGDVPPPDYTAGFASLSISDESLSDVPQVNETIAHLKTLECF